jgi:cytochrome c oxidase subunit 2
VSELFRRLVFLPDASSTFAPKVDRLHAIILGSTLLAAVVIGAAGLFFLVRYRRGARRSPGPQRAAPWWLEALFIGGPLALFLAWFVMGFEDFVWAQSPPRDALDVYVSAKQWMWEFSVPEGPSAINVLHVPAGRPVRLLMTSRDVIHSFYVPDFRLKRDALPSRYVEAWFEAPRPGVHDIFCAEYCGLDHSVMRAQVVVLSPEDFEAWRAGSAPVAKAVLPAGNELATRGVKVAAEAGCLKCHTLDGSKHLGPTWKGLYGSLVTLRDGTTVRADEAYLTESMMEPGAKLVNGFTPLMPSFLGQLSPGQTAALVELIKSLRTEPVARGGGP